MKTSETKDFGKISLRATYRSKEWEALVKSILKAEGDLQQVMESLNRDEVEKFYKVVEGRARCDTFEKVIQRTAIEGSERSLVSFNDAYVPDFITGRLETFPASLSEEDRRRILEQTEIVELTEWQVKRGYCYLLAQANIEASKDCVKRRRFSSAMNYLCQALMQIGAASARDPVEIEKMVGSRKGLEAAKVRISKDPKQADKKKVREYWDRWQVEPNLYKTQESFARDMLEKFGEEGGCGSLTSTATIIKKWIPEFRASSQKK
ncbi:hypothetical protein [Burkholderia cenocepacia]|uniref:hypothetical protein n=1 Tax=Burkholderia cenocepacia TaxID=95486 RepID=UPI0028642643|nr:hypothetical protein [Burkholderia cenocepacia]MDR5660984.1 hypothetical protein [Burkholderia cenocepacia]MDR8094142.1 hypothetical protein [Burkholderia cenocepacia]